MFCFKLPLYFAEKVVVRVSLATCIFTCTMLPFMVPTQPIIEALSLIIISYFVFRIFSQWLFFSEVLSTSMSCSFQSLLFTLFRLLNDNFHLSCTKSVCVCVRVRAAKHRMFKDKVEMKRWDVKRYNTWKFVAISLIHAKRNLH